MAGDASKVRSWDDAEVYVRTADAPEGTGDPLVLTAGPDAWTEAGFTSLGLLSGEEGLVQTRDSEKRETYAWGAGLIKESESKFKRVIKVVALESSATVLGVVNPSDEVTTTGGKTTTVHKVPRHGILALGIEKRSGDHLTRTVYDRARISEVGDLTDSEEEDSIYELSFSVYATDGVYGESVEGEIE